MNLLRFGANMGNIMIMGKIMILLKTLYNFGDNLLFCSWVRICQRFVHTLNPLF